MSWWQNDTAVGDEANLDKFLGVLKWAEGGAPNRIVGGGTFSDFSKHPRIVGLRTKEGPSTAAGDYQITATTYDDIAPKIGVQGFDEKAQRAIAIELIRRNKAYDDVLKGDFTAAINKLGSVWASLPSSPYSQPKKSWDAINQRLGVQVASNNNWWANDAPAEAAGGGGDWWANDTPAEAPVESGKKAASTVSTPAAAAPVAAPKTAAQVVQAAKKEEPRGVLRRVDDFVRGAADTLTFGYADEFAAKMDSLFGGGQSGKKAYDEALAAQRERDKQGGGERIAGQVAGALLPTVGVVRAVPGATRLARAGAGAATGAIQGGLYGTGSAEGALEDRLKGGAVGAGVGAIAGGALGAVLPASITQKGNALIKSAGSDDAARFDAEIITDLKKLADSPSKRGNPMTTIDANAIETKYINDVNSALKQLGKTQDVSAVREAIMNRRALTPDDLTTIRGSAAGNAAADAIEKAQRLRSMTQAMQSSGGLLPLMREGVDLLPIPAAVNRGLKAALGGRQTREVSIQKALKQVPAAENVLERLGPSKASRSLFALDAAVDTAQKAQSSKAAAAQAAKETAREAAEQLRIRNLQLGIRSNPGFQTENLQITGGTRGTLQYYGRLADSKELAKGLRMIQKTDPYLAPYIKQVKQNKNVPNKEILLGLTDRLKQMRDQGILKPYMKQ